jgi:hypothetical protein
VDFRRACNGGGFSNESLEAGAQVREEYETIFEDNFSVQADGPLQNEKV